MLRAYGRERFYVRDLPVHPSQRLLADTEDHADYEVRLRPTAGIEGFLLSRGAWLEVIEPKWLADSVADRLEVACGGFTCSFGRGMCELVPDIDGSDCLFFVMCLCIL